MDEPGGDSVGDCCLTPAIDAVPEEESSELLLFAVSERCISGVPLSDIVLCGIWHAHQATPSYEGHKGHSLTIRVWKFGKD